MTPDTIVTAILSAGGSVAASIGVLKLWVKWKRDAELASIESNRQANEANAAEVRRLWEYNNSQDAKIKQLESKIEELRIERHRLISENQALKQQNEDQAVQLRDMTSRNTALTLRVSELERHLGTLERRLAEMGGGKVGGAGQALT